MKLPLWLGVCLAVVVACAPSDENVGVDRAAVGAPLPQAFCEIYVDGIGVIDMEGDYLPHVITCENGGAGLEALKAQAVAARSVAYYYVATQGGVCDGQGCQVYSCNAAPGPIHYQAVQETAGQYLAYGGMLTYAFYVAGDANASPPGCIDYGGSTSQFVTYNAGKTGGDVEQTSLGYIGPPGFGQNRGCMSQWGARCLENGNGYGYADILRFYYGADIEIQSATGPCTTTPQNCTVAQANACGAYGCWCVNGECNGGYCPGTGCTEQDIANCGAYGCGCVDGQCNGGYCDATGCTAKEATDCSAFGCSCVDHQCNGGACEGSGCTAKETDNCAAFGCGCVDHQCNGAYCEGTGCTAKQTSDCAADDKACEMGACIEGDVIGEPTPEGEPSLPPVDVPEVEDDSGCSYGRAPGRGAMVLFILMAGLVRRIRRRS